MSKTAARLAPRDEGGVDVLDRPGPPAATSADIALDSPDRFINRELSWLDLTIAWWKRQKTRITRCWSASGSSR